MTLSRRLGPGTHATYYMDDAQLEVRDRILERLAGGAYQLRALPCFCGDPGGLVVAERDRYGLPVRTVLCSTCGLMRTDPYMTPETTRRFYEEDYRGLYSADGPAALYEKQRQKGELLAPRLLKIPGVETVYDIGCGAGGLLVPFAEAGLEVAGCDYGPEHLEFGRGVGLGGLVQGSVRDLLEHRGGKQADLVTLMHVAEHFLDLRSELNAVIEAVRPGGLLLMEVPGVKTMHVGAYEGDLLCYLQNAHTFHFCADTLSWVMRNLGMRVLSVDEHVLMLAQRPFEQEGVVWETPSAETVRGVMAYLGEMERKMLERAQGSASR